MYRLDLLMEPGGSDRFRFIPLDQVVLNQQVDSSFKSTELGMRKFVGCLFLLLVGGPGSFTFIFIHLLDLTAAPLVCVFHDVLVHVFLAPDHKFEPLYVSDRLTNER